MCADRRRPPPFIYPPTPTSSSDNHLHATILPPTQITRNFMKGCDVFGLSL